MAGPDFAKLCQVCSKLNIEHITHPLHPCREPLPCSSPPGHSLSASLTLGSIDGIKSRRSSCDLCQLIAESLDKEPSDLGGECRIVESGEFCNFTLPSNHIEPVDPSITHFHLTQTSVIFDPSAEGGQVQGPSLPWEIKERDAHGAHFILWLQAKARYPNLSPKIEQKFLDSIGGRSVAAQIDPQLIGAWLDLCESKHGKDCMPSSQLPAEHNREPTFVIDVIDSCVVSTPSQCRYVALSYVWGTATMYKHLRANTQDIQMKDSLRSSRIPSTIRDAITLVRTIGERYLWVDSLCIIQDDLMMQQTEILRMGSIYSRALFTIIAASGNNADSGLPGVERASREVSQKTLKFASGELLTVIDVRYTPSGVDGTPWAQRAWTFQERVLSTRVLVFSENQVYWSCRAAVYSEERALEEALDVDQRYLSFPQNSTTDHLSWEPLQLLDYCILYNDLLVSYRQRRLTYQTDLLNAFNGVSGILSAIQNDTFLWGLPESLFSYAMTWTSVGRSARNGVHVPIFKSDGSADMIQIPSWSWAAWSAEDPNQLPLICGGKSPLLRSTIDFYVVDTKRQLVRIKERPFSNHSKDSVRAVWQVQQLAPLPTFTHDSLFQIGRLYFWTSFANLKAVRCWRIEGPGEVDFIPFFASEPDLSSTVYHKEIVEQDFIVIAAMSYGVLLLLAIEWRDGVAYRVGKAEVSEADWVQIKNREWRLIVLG